MPHAKTISEAAISPDGSRVAYVLEGRLTVVTLSDNTNHSIEVEGKLDLRAAAWSTDSKQLVFLADLPTEAPSAQ